MLVQFDVSISGGFSKPMHYYRNIFQYDIEEPKIKISVPSLILWGENDHALSTNNATE